MASTNYHYNKRLKQFARDNRSESTKAENKLWYEALQNRQMLGYRFLRQRAIGNYIADFFSKEFKLVKEVDGWSHRFEEIRKKDELKDKYLKQLGFSVLRFHDDEVVNDFENVLRVIETWMLQYEKTHPDVRQWKKE